jgi:general secretion pathway protein C
MNTVLQHARAPRIAVWVLAAVLGVQAAVILMHLGNDGARHLLPGGQAGMGSSARRPPDLVALANGHLFGAASLPAGATDREAPQTRMPLVLSGIFAAKDPNDGMAIIGTSASNAKVYPVGGDVPGNARVQAIYVDRVLLDRDGVIEALILPRKFGGAGSSVEALQAVPAPLDRLRNTLASESGPGTDSLGAQPVFAQGKLRGYRVYPHSNDKMGLRRGDLVVAINGTALDEATGGNDIMSSLGNADQTRVTVLRGGKPYDITVNRAPIAN